VKLTVTLSLLPPDPCVTVVIVGAPGRVLGVADAEALATLLPMAFVAMTVNVYAVPFVRPVTTWLVLVEPALLSTPPAGLAVTV